MEQQQKEITNKQKNMQYSVILERKGATAEQSVRLWPACFEYSVQISLSGFKVFHR